MNATVLHTTATVLVHRTLCVHTTSTSRINSTAAWETPDRSLSLASGRSQLREAARSLANLVCYRDTAMTDLNDRNIADAGADANERSPQSSRSRTPLASPMPSRSRARSEASDSGNSGVGGRAVGSAVTHDGHSTPQRPESRAEDETLNGTSVSVGW